MLPPDEDTNKNLDCQVTSASTTQSSECARSEGRHLSGNSRSSYQEELMDECHDLEGTDYSNYKGSKRHAAEIMRDSHRSSHSLKNQLASIDEESPSADNDPSGDSQSRTDKGDPQAPHSSTRHVTIIYKDKPHKKDHKPKRKSHRPKDPQREQMKLMM